MSDYEDLIYKEKNGVAKITINRPDKMNAFRAETCEELLHALNRAGWNKKIGVVVLGGAGDRAFCAGADIKELGPRTSEQIRDASRRGQKIGLRIENLPFPSLALLNGFALGGGLEGLEGVEWR